MVESMSSRHEAMGSSPATLWLRLLRIYGLLLICQYQKYGPNGILSTFTAVFCFNYA